MLKPLTKMVWWKQKERERLHYRMGDDIQGLSMGVSEGRTKGGLDDVVFTHRCAICLK